MLRVAKDELAYKTRPWIGVVNLVRDGKDEGKWWWKIQNFGSGIGRDVEIAVYSKIGEAKPERVEIPPLTVFPNQIREIKMAFNKEEIDHLNRGSRNSARITIKYSVYGHDEVVGQERSYNLPNDGWVVTADSA